MCSTGRSVPGDGARLIVAAIRVALDDERRLDFIESAIGTITDHGHEWDDDSAAWVRQQRPNGRLSALGGRLATGSPRHFPFDELDVEHWPARA